MEFKNYIFDVDGTLLDTYSVAYRAKEKVLKEYNIPYTKELIDLGFASTSLKSLELCGVDVDSSLGKEIVKKENQYYNDFAKEITIFPKMLDKIKQLHLNHNLAIITSRTKEEVINEPKLQPLLPYFDYIITASDVVNPKPNKECLEKLFSLSNWEKQDTIFIGDSVNDSKCAYSYGIKFGLAGWGAVSEVKCDYYLKNIDEITG